MVEYRHSLTKAQVRPLAKLNAAGGGPLNITDDLKLTRGEYTNFAKLAYWNLVKKEGDTERGGRWQITEAGRQFIRGEITRPRVVWVYRGSVQRTEGKVTVMDCTGGWKYRPEYARDARPHPNAGQREML